jgi:hypothetical protein
MIGSDLSNRICEVLAFDGHFLANLFWGFRRIARRDSVSLERMERGIRPLAETSKPARNRQLLGEMQRLLLADSVARLFCASERARLSQDQAPPLRHSFSRMAPARTPRRSSSTTAACRVTGRRAACSGLIEVGAGLARGKQVWVVSPYWWSISERIAAIPGLVDSRAFSQPPNRLLGAGRLLAGPMGPV